MEFHTFGDEDNKKVLLLHGMLCDWKKFRDLLKPLEESYYVIYPAMTGCYERCLQGMRKEPGAHVPAELNRKIHFQFADYINNFLDYESYLYQSDESSLADFGTYMDNYEE